MKSLFNLSVCLAVIGLVAPAFAATAYDDNFDDNTLGSAWTEIIDAPATLDAAEQNQRLEVLATGGGPANQDAIYLSDGADGFRLSTAADFEIAIDYSFTNASATGGIPGTGDAMLLVLGIGRDLDGTDSAAIGLGYVNAFGAGVLGLAAGSRVDDAQTNTPILNGLATGTLVVAYDTALDRLTLGDDIGNVTTIDNMVVGQWLADDVFVSFGARGTGFATSSGDAFLDNFVIRNGTVVVPTPTAATAMITLCGVLVTRRRRRIS